MNEVLMSPDELVTDPTEREPARPNPIAIPDFELISGWRDGFDIADKVSSVVGLLYEIGKDIFSDDKPPPAPPGGGSSPTGGGTSPAIKTTECRCDVQIIVNANNVTTEIKHEDQPGGAHGTTITIKPHKSNDPKEIQLGVTEVKITDRKSGGLDSPKPIDTSGPITTPEPIDTTEPISTPEPIDTTEPISTPEPIDLAGVEGGKYIPADPGYAARQALARYHEILNEVYSLHFSDQATADAHLAKRLEDSGLLFMLTEDGRPQAVEKIPDPARVEENLRSRGIKDQSSIKQAVSEANAALLDIERFVKSAQTSLAGAKEMLASEQELGASAPRLSSVFESLAPTWTSYIPGGFTTISTPPQGGKSEPQASTKLTSAVFFALEYKSPSGVEIGAIVSTQSISRTSTSPPAGGIYVAPFVSVFTAERASILIA